MEVPLLGKARAGCLALSCASVVCFCLVLCVASGCVCVWQVLFVLLFVFVCFLVVLVFCSVCLVALFPLLGVGVLCCGLVIVVFGVVWLCGCVVSAVLCGWLLWLLWVGCLFRASGVGVWVCGWLGLPGP